MPKATVAAVITKKDCPNEVLLTHRTIEPFKNQWCLPGGHIDRRESARNAAIREVKEEVGLDFDAAFFGYFDEIIPSPRAERGAPARLLDTFFAFLRRIFGGSGKRSAGGPNIHAVVLVFEGVGEGELLPQRGEVSEARWFPLEKARALRLTFTHNDILKAYAPQSHGPADALRSDLLAEYAALRDELLKQLDRRYQLLILTITAAGVFVTVGTKSMVTPPVILLYPIFATFLMQAWTHADIRVGQIGEYLRNRIERRLQGIGWETYLRAEYDRPGNRSFKRLVEGYAAGIFVTTQLLSVLFAVFLQIEQAQPPAQWILFIALLVLDFAAFWHTLSLVRMRRARYRRHWGQAWGG